MNMNLYAFVIFVVRSTLSSLYKTKLSWHHSTRSASREDSLLTFSVSMSTQQCVNVGVSSPASTKTTMLRCPQGQLVSYKLRVTVAASSQLEYSFPDLVGQFRKITIYRMTLGILSFQLTPRAIRSSRLTPFQSLGSESMFQILLYIAISLDVYYVTDVIKKSINFLRSIQ